MKQQMATSSSVLPLVTSSSLTSIWDSCSSSVCGSGDKCIRKWRGRDLSTRESRLPQNQSEHKQQIPKQWACWLHDYGTVSSKDKHYSHYEINSLRMYNIYWLMFWFKVVICIYIYPICDSSFWHMVIFLNT